MGIELPIADSVIQIAAFVAAPWVLFALISAFGDASVGFIDEWLLRKIRLGAIDEKTVDAPGRLLLFSGFFGILVSLIAILLSLASSGAYPFLVSKQAFLYAFSAGLLEVLWMIPYFYALERGSAINATPLFQSIPIFSLLFGLLFFAEIPTVVQVVATLLIIAGAVILNYTPTTRKMQIPVLVNMFLASAIISIGYFLFKDATVQGNFVASLFGNGLGMGMLSACIYILYAPYRVQFNTFISKMDSKIFFLQFSNEFLYSVSTVASQLAIVLGPSVMVVTALNAFHPIFTLLIGFCLALLGHKAYSHSFHGTQRYTTILGIVLITLGTIVLGLG